MTFERTAYVLCKVFAGYDKTFARTVNRKYTCNVHYIIIINRENIILYREIIFVVRERRIKYNITFWKIIKTERVDRGITPAEVRARNRGGH